MNGLQTTRTTSTIPIACSNRRFCLVREVNVDLVLSIHANTKALTYSQRFIWAIFFKFCYFLSFSVPFLCHFFCISFYLCIFCRDCFWVCFFILLSKTTTAFIVRRLKRVRPNGAILVNGAIFDGHWQFFRKNVAKMQHPDKYWYLSKRLLFPMESK